MNSLQDKLQAVFNELPIKGEAALKMRRALIVQGLFRQAIEQVYKEKFAVGQHIRALIIKAEKNVKGPNTVLSRAHPDLVKVLFELEVPEIHDGIVVLKSIAREAGMRSKIAVFSNDEKVDPVGSCVGHKGMRVQNIVNELRGEKIDIVKYNTDPAQYVANALSPAQVISAAASDTEKICWVVVPDYQLSLAIGKEGQNARLAAKLTGWQIDIKPESQVEEADTIREGSGEEA